MTRMVLLAATALLAVGPASAQVSVDLKALDGVPGAGSGGAPSAGAGTQHQASPAHRRPHGSGTAGKSASQQAAAKPAKPAAATPAAPLPALPTAPPAEAHLTPIPTPAAPTPTAPPEPPAAEAEPEAPLDGVRLAFAAGSSELAPESMSLLRRVSAAALAGPVVTIDVRAYAPAAPDDPSSSRRLSLSRSLAVRTALLADGIASTRIFVRALGPNYGDGPPDRVDVLLQRPGEMPHAEAAPSAPPPTTTPAAPPSAPR